MDTDCMVERTCKRCLTSSMSIPGVKASANIAYRSDNADNAPTCPAVHGLHHDADGELHGEDAHQVERRAVN